MLKFAIWSCNFVGWLTTPFERWPEDVDVERRRSWAWRGVCAVPMRRAHSDPGFEQGCSRGGGGCLGANLHRS